VRIGIVTLRECLKYSQFFIWWSIRLAAVLRFLEMQYRPDDWSELTVTSLGYGSLVRDCRHSHAT